MDKPVLWCQGLVTTKTLVFGAVEVIRYADKHEHGQAAERAGRIRLAIA